MVEDAIEKVELGVLPHELTVTGAGLQELPLSRYPELQLAQMLAPFEVQEVPVAAVPWEHEHVLDVQAPE